MNRWLRRRPRPVASLVTALRRRIRRRDGYQELRRSLRQSHSSTPYDLYLARTVVYAALGAVAGVLPGFAVAALISAADVAVGVPAPAVVADHADALLDAGLIVAGAAVGAGSVAAYRVSVPVYRARHRASRIDLALPHALVFMHAMSYGGANILEVFERLAEADDAYGAAAEEIDVAVKNVQFVGDEFKMAVSDLYEVTPSHQMKLFLDDLLGVIRAGGDITLFLEDRSQRALERAESDQKDFLETLGVISEIYTTMFVAAPLLLIVVLLVIGVTGGETLATIYVIVYAGLPLGVVGFLVLLDALDATLQPAATLDVPARPGASEEPPDDERYEAVRRRRRREEITRTVLHFPAAVRQRPALTLLATLPVVALYLALAVAAGWADPFAMLDDPIPTTTTLVAIPMLLVLTPLAAFHWLHMRRREQLLGQFPEKLTSLANSNEMGLSLTKAIALVSRQSRGLLSREFRQVSNDIGWNADTGRALLQFANRLKVPQISQTMKLVTEARASSGQLYRTLNIAAHDAHIRKSLRDQRFREMAQHLSIIVIGFLVYLFVILLLEQAFLGPIVERTRAVESLPEAGVPVGFTGAPVEQYRMLFYHSALIMGVGNGVLAGKMTRNDAVSGLRFSAIFVAIAAVAFTVVVG